MLRLKKKIKSFDDLELVALFQSSKDNVYVGELFDRYNHLVYGVCLKYLSNVEESKDAVIKIFEKLLEKLQGEQIENFSSWLYSVSKNFCLMHLRSTKRLLNRQEKYEVENKPNAEENNLSLDYKEDMRLSQLSDSINLLKSEQRECIELFFLKEKCYKEITEITGFTLKEVKSFIQNGKRNLKNILSKQDEAKV